MPTYDIVMAVILIGATLHGLIRGMAWQLAPIAALVLGYVIGRPLAPHVAHWFGAPPTNELVALLVLYVGVSAGVFFLARMLKGMIAHMKMDAYDRHLGFLLGGVKGVLFCLVATFFLVGLSKQARDAIMPTHSGKMAAVIMDQLHPVMPESFHDLVEEHIHSLDERLDGENYHERVNDHLSTAKGDHQKHDSEKSGDGSLVDQALRILDEVKK